MDFTEAYADRCSTIGRAAREGDVCQLQRLLREGRPTDVRDNRGWEPLHEAAWANNTGCLQVLLQKGNVNVNAKSFEGETALLLAAKKGNHQCIAALLHYGADPNLTTPEGYSALWEAVNARSYQCVKLLIEKNANLEAVTFTQTTALHQAVEMNEIRILICLLKCGARFDVVDENHLTPIFLAAQKGHFECLKILLEKSAESDFWALGDVAAFDGATPLLAAAQEGHYKCVELLLSYKANPNIFTLDSIPICALQTAIVCNKLSCVRLLYKVTDLERIKENCSSEWQPVCLALDLATTDILRYLLTEDPTRDMTVSYENWRHQNFWEKAPLLSHATSRTMMFDTVKTLLEYGFEVNDFRDGLMPPMLSVLKSKRLDFFELFWEYGACPNVYHPHMSGNCCVLFALDNDLTSQDITLPNFDGPFLQQVLRHGADVRSCLLNESQPFGDEPCQNISSLFENHQLNEQYFDTILNVLLFMGGSFLCLNESLAKYVSKNEWAKLKQTNEKNSSLSHLCRLQIIRILQKNKKYDDDSIASLALPLAAQEMLQLDDCGKYQYFLKKVFKTT